MVIYCIFTKKSMRYLVTIILICFFCSITIAQTQKLDGDTLLTEIVGSIISKNKNELKVVFGNHINYVSKIGTKGELQKSFETQMFGATVNGWLSIAEVSVKSISKDIVTFYITKELSIITENGVKKNHFVKGQEVKFISKEIAGEDMIAYNKGMEVVETDMDEAYLHFKKATSINKLYDEAWNMLGIIKNEKKEFDSAVYYFNKAYLLDTTNLNYINNLTMTHISLPNYELSYKYAEKGVIHASEDAETHYLRAITYLYYLSGKISDIQKKQILDDLDFAVSVDVDDPYFYKERMMVRSYFHDDAGACEDAKKYHELSGKMGESFIKQYCKE